MREKKTESSLELFSIQNMRKINKTLKIHGLITDDRM